MDVVYFPSGSVMTLPGGSLGPFTLYPMARAEKDGDWVRVNLLEPAFITLDGNHHIVAVRPAPGCGLAPQLGENRILNGDAPLYEAYSKQGSRKCWYFGDAGNVPLMPNETLFPSPSDPYVALIVQV